MGGVGHGLSQREEYDYYATDPKAMELLGETTVRWFN
jgi:hypothetical protein